MTPTKTTPKDFFLHLGAVVVLYASIVAIINLAFSIINYAFPDKLNYYFSTGSIAWPISMLVILVPLLYVFEWIIIKAQNIDLSKKDIWIRRWRIYLTLFLTGGTVVGDVITLIYTYLNGEISSRFVYKVLIVLFICSAVFKYYFFTINENSMWSSSYSKMAKTMIPWFGIVLTLAVIIGGFVIVGSPTKQRNIRFDNQRVNDLTNIQSQIVTYWQQKGSLPTTLKDTNDGLNGYNIPNDPENDSEYVYKVIVPSKIPTFELCATFALETQNINKTYYINEGNDNWKHGAGLVCYSRTIDEDIYRTNKRPILLEVPKGI